MIPRRARGIPHDTRSMARCNTNPQEGSKRGYHQSLPTFPANVFCQGTLCQHLLLLLLFTAHVMRLVRSIESLIVACPLDSSDTFGVGTSKLKVGYQACFSLPLSLSHKPATQLGPLQCIGKRITRN